MLLKVYWHILHRFHICLQKTNPDLTPDREIYPVMVYIHSGEFTHGTSQQYPGHVLATRDVVVVTFNYRLGALGKSLIHTINMTEGKAFHLSTVLPHNRHRCFSSTLLHACLTYSLS